MKKSIKKLSALAFALTLSITTVSSVYAEYDPDKTVASDEISTKMALPANSVSVDGELIEGAKLISTENSILIPVRAAAEALGFEVIWENDIQRVSLSNLPHYITFQIGVDGYTFARTAPMPLGTAPALVEGVTYVPIELLTDIMNLTVEKSNNSINIISEKKEIEVLEEEFENNEEILGEGEIVSIDEENSQVLINDSIKGEVLLNIGDLSIIKDEDGNALNFSELKEGDSLTVEYSPAMTMSIPPVNNPVKVIIK